MSLRITHKFFLLLRKYNGAAGIGCTLSALLCFQSLNKWMAGQHLSDGSLQLASPHAVDDKQGEPWTQTCDNIRFSGFGAFCLLYIKREDTELLGAASADQHSGAAPALRSAIKASQTQAADC